MSQGRSRRIRKKDLPLKGAAAAKAAAAQAAAARAAVGRESPLSSAAAAVEASAEADAQHETDEQQRYEQWKAQMQADARKVFTTKWREARAKGKAQRAADAQAAARMLELYEQPDVTLHEGLDYEQATAGQRQKAQREADREAQRQWLRDMRGGLRHADWEFMQSLAASRVTVPGYGSAEQALPKKRQIRELDAMTQVHAQMLAQMCMAPLKQGVSPGSVVQAASTFATLMVLSPKMRQEVGHHGDRIRAHFEDRRDERRERQHEKYLDKTMAKADKAAAKLEAGEKTGVPGFRKVGERLEDYLSKDAQERVADAQREMRGHRDLLTPASAAATEVGLMDSAYWRMRDPSTDSKEVYRSYRALQEMLHERMEADGVDRAETMQRARTIIGHRLEEEPEMATMFKGMAYGRVQKSAPRTVRLPGSKLTREVWDGEFENHLGEPLADGGMFVLRPPEADEELQAHLSATMKMSIIDSLNKADPDSLQNDLYSYPVGFAVMQSDLSIDGLPPGMRHRMEQTQMMISTMAADGMDEATQREVFSNAYVDAINEVMTEVPDFEAYTEHLLGHSWDVTLERMDYACDHPDEFTEAMRDAYARQQERAEKARAKSEPQSGRDRDERPDPQP